MGIVNFFKRLISKKGRKQKIDCKFMHNKIKNMAMDNLSSVAISPKAIIIQVGDNPASNKYIKNKIKHCGDVGIRAELIKLDERVSEPILIGLINQYNENVSVDGIIVQLPLPKHINQDYVLDAIDPFKDIDCLTKENIGLLHMGQQDILPCTPAGIMKMFDFMNYDLKGKSVLIIGRSQIVGRPLFELMIQANATVTLAHSHSDFNINGYDVVVSAIGKAKHFVVNNKNAILVDVGINFDEDGKMCGDFDIDKCNCELYTSVPGGVGLLTTAMVCHNVTSLALKAKGVVISR